VTSQLVPSVMICAWIFFFMSKRGEETRKAATFVCTGQYAVHTRRAETDKLSLAVLPRPSRSYIHTHKLSLSLIEEGHTIPPFLVLALPGKG
jgi:hypothetical protein